MSISGKDIEEAMKRSVARLKKASPEEILAMLKRIDPGLETRQHPKARVRKSGAQHKRTRQANA